MKIPFDEPPVGFESLRMQRIIDAHDDMKRVIDGVIMPEFNQVVRIFIERSLPWDIKTHKHGVILNFGKPDKQFTIAYYGYPNDRQFEVAISPDGLTTHNFWIPFNIVFPSDVKSMFEEFFDAYVPDLKYKAEHKEYELHDLHHIGPYQLRVNHTHSTSVLATVDCFEEILSMATTLSDSFRGKDMVITDEEGSLIC